MINRISLRHTKTTIFRELNELDRLDIYDSKDLYELGILSSYDKRILINEKFRKKHIQI